MCGEYSIQFNCQQVGTVQIFKNGLYYRIQAVCRLENNTFMRLLACSGETVIDFGLLVPENDYFILTKDIPVKRIADTNIRFWLHGNKDHRIPVKTDKPFQYLTHLEHLKLIVESGSKYIDSGIWDYSSNKTGQ